MTKHLGFKGQRDWSGAVRMARRAAQKISFFWVTPYFSESILFKKKAILELQGEYLEEYIKGPSLARGELSDSAAVAPETLLKGIIAAKWRTILGVVLLKFGNILLSFLFTSYLSSFMKSVTPREHTMLGLKAILVYLVRLIFESQNRFHSGRLALGIEALLLRLSYSRLVFSFNCGRRSDLEGEDKSQRGCAFSNIMNIVLADCSSLPNLIISALDLLMFPVRFMLTWILLREQVGSVASSAVFTFLAAFSLGFLLQAIGSLFKAPFMRYRDIRISTTHKMFREFSQIRLIGQEGLIKSQIFSIRQKEAFYNRLRLILIQVGTFLDYHVQSISQLVLFISYISKAMEEDQNTRSGSSLQSLGPTGITVLNIFFTVSSIRGLPSNMIEGFISLRRFQEFLQNTQSRAADSFLAPETPTSRCPLLEDDLVLDFKGSRVAKSAPEPNQSCERLEETKPMIEGDCPSRLKSHTFFNDLSLRVKKREKVFLIGEPGSGKTTFVQEVLLNHHLMLNTQHKHGYFYYNYHLLKKLPIGYVSQIPWIPSGTVRSIILFGSEYDEDQYKRIIECCNLTTDFEQWKEGDLKQVDEGGGSLSKGQKTRVCIARALYHFFSSKELRRHCPLFIFDDVFSNLDQFVANKLFYSLLGSNGVLSGSSVLITIDQRSLSTFLKYASSLDSGSSFSLYSSFQFISIQGFNCSKRPFLEPQQALAGSAESALADTHIGTLMNNNGSMIFSPRDSSSTPSTSCPSSSYVMDLGCTPEASPQTSESDRLIPQNCSHTISYTKENVANKGHISLDSYLWYLSNTGKSFIVALLIISLCKSGLERLSEILFTGESTHTQTLQKFLLLYSLSTSLSLLLGGLVFLLEAIACTFGANSIHRRIFEALHVKVPNVIPVHIMLNRIGGDMLVVDTCIVKSIFSCLAPVLTIVGQTVFIVYTFPYFTPCFLVWVMLVIRPICQTFISSYREYQRFSISLFSSICGIFSGTQHGGSVITMLRKQETLKAQASESIDLYIKAKCIQLASTQWAGFWMNMAMTPIGILLNVLFFRFGDGSKSGSAIICIYYFLSIAEFISSLMYKFVQLEKEMCSVERIKDYIGVVNRLNERIIQMGESCRGAALGGGGPEAAAAEERSGPPRSREAVCGPQGSPSLGSCSMEGLVIQDLQVSTISQSSVGGELNNESVDGLRFETLLSIHGTLRALPGSVIGIIGRTGSGKSSLVNSIIGLHLQTKGAILLNNVETRTISQKNKIIGLLPQESFLMEGATIRSLLDPFSEHSDDQLLRALDNAGLAEFIQLLPSKLETTIVPQDPGGAATDYSLTGIPGSSSMAIKLSNSQIRYLYFIQFTISPNKLQLLLADEPPLNVTFSFGGLTFATPSIHNIIGSTFKHCPCLIITHNMDIFNNCDAFWIIKNNQLLKVLQRLPGNAPNLTCTEIP